jgi:hypothetical protein
VGALASPSSTARVCPNPEGHSWLGVQVLGTILAGRAQVGSLGEKGDSALSGLRSQHRLSSALVLCDVDALPSLVMIGYSMSAPSG